jgi:arylsulfatase A-like enzyme
VIAAAAGLAAVGVALGAPRAGACPPVAPTGAPAPGDGAQRLNVVLIVTDDQRADTLAAMPNVQRMLAGHGVTFRNSFVTTPLCCPSRASLLTGQYAHTTGVYDNVRPWGGIEAFDDSSTLATWLQDAGYTTSLVGKYMNGYERFDRCHFPPGWSDWHAIAKRTSEFFYNFDINDNGDVTHIEDDPSDYSMSVLAERALTFLGDARPPFFLYLAVQQPHRPSTPAPGDIGSFESAPFPYDPSFNELDIADKPVLGDRERLSPDEVAYLDRQHERMMESLLSVDRTAASIVHLLEERGLLSHTVVILTSDNGFMLGEHRLVSKVWPYDASIRVPLVVRVPWSDGPSTDDRLVLNIDLASTIAELAGIEPGLPQDGRSLVPLLHGLDVPWRHDFLIEWLSPRTTPIVPPPFTAIRTRRYLYVKYETGERELYDHRTDSYEVENLADSAGTKAIRRRLAERLEELANS